MKVDGGFCIREIVKPGDKKNLYVLIFLTHPAGQLNPVKHRHLDIRNDDIGAFGLHQFEHFHPVFTKTGDRKAALLPVNDFLNAFPHDPLIVGKYQLVHISCPPIAASLRKNVRYYILNSIAHFIKYYKYLSDFVKRLDRFTRLRRTSFPPPL